MKRSATEQWIAAVTFAFLSLGSATMGQDLELVRTKIIDGFYIGVCDTDGKTNRTSAENRLVFGVWRTATNNTATVFIPTAPEYIYQLDLFDTNGLALPKTKLGKPIGTKFSDIDTSFSGKEKLTRAHVADEPSIAARPLFFPFKPGYGGQPYYSPNDLFEIKNPGHYTLRIRFQVIVRTGTGNSKAAHIVRFPQLEYPLVKPESTQTNRAGKL